MFSQIVPHDQASDLLESIGPDPTSTRGLCSAAKRVSAIFLTALVGFGLISDPFVLVTEASATAVQGSSPISVANSLLLVKSDFPKSWTSSASPNNNSSLPGEAQLASCIGVPRSVLMSNPPSASSPEFDSPDHLLSVDDSVAIYPSSQGATADFNLLANVKTPACLASVWNGPAKATIEKEFGSVSIVGAIKVTRVASKYFAPGGANITMQMRLKSQGVQLNLDLTMVDYVKANKEQMVTLISVVQGFPAAFARQLTTEAVHLIR